MSADTSVPLADPSAPFSAGETEYREMREEKKDSAIRSRRTETNFAARHTLYLYLTRVSSKPREQIDILLLPSL